MACECADEAGAVFVSKGVGDFLDGHPAARQELAGFLHFSFGEDVTQALACLKLEDVFEMRAAQIESTSEILDAA